MLNFLYCWLKLCECASIGVIYITVYKFGLPQTYSNFHLAAMFMVIKLTRHSKSVAAVGFSDMFWLENVCALSLYKAPLSTDAGNKCVFIYSLLRPFKSCPI